LNTLDIAVIAVILLLALIGWARGFVKSCFSFLPPLAALCLTGKLYPYVSDMLRATPLFNILKAHAASGLHLDTAATTAGDSAIGASALPQFLKGILIANNNKVVYGLLDATDLKDYVAGYIANICINVISVVLVAVGLFILFKLIVGMLDLVTHLPVISTFNHIGGFMIGTFEGVILIWLMFMLAVFFCQSDKAAWFYTELSKSRIAEFLFEKNIFLHLVSNIHT